MCFSNNQKLNVLSRALKIMLSLTLIAASVTVMFGCNIFSQNNDTNKNYVNDIDTSNFNNPSVKNNGDLVKWCEMAYKNGWGYVYGTFGYVLSEQMIIDKCAQYPKDVGENEDFIRANWLGKRTVDCMGLIKSYMWYNPQSKSITYNGGHMPDIGCDRLFEEASVKGTIDSIPEKKGLAVWAKGHIGIYIGDGYVIEAQSTHDGVKKTKISKRNWTHWFEIPQINYNE